MPTDKKSYTYTPRPNTMSAARSTPFDQTKIMPAPSKSAGGKYGGIKKPATGGKMQGGGKRRSNRMSK